jgi:NAD-dependent dihydropyrimidine dehydrogenase PreA subunit
MKVKRKIIEIDDELCDGCGQCVPSCAEGAIEIINGKARLVEDKYCDGLGACLGECPTGALSVIEREAEEFDEEAVEEHLQSKDLKADTSETTLPCGCPSTQIQNFLARVVGDKKSEPVLKSGMTSALSHWPVQIRLVPATAPFLKGADLLVVADCVPFAYPNFHQDFLKGKVVMTGCPKFDDIQEYVNKFVEIFKTADIERITAPIMEVPCCAGLPLILKRAMDVTKKQIPVEVVVIGTRGHILKKEQLAA